MEKTVSKEYHRITDITQGKSGGVGINAMILKNYNDGRHGGWNNYCCYNNKSLVASFVKKHAQKDTKAVQHKEHMAKTGRMVLEQSSGNPDQSASKGTQEGSAKKSE